MILGVSCDWNGAMRVMFYVLIWMLVTLVGWILKLIEMYIYDLCICHSYCNSLNFCKVDETNKQKKQVYPACIALIICFALFSFNEQAPANLRLYLWPQSRKMLMGPYRGQGHAWPQLQKGIYIGCHFSVFPFHSGRGREVMGKGKENGSHWHNVCKNTL